MDGFLYRGGRGSARGAGNMSSIAEAVKVKKVKRQPVARHVKELRKVAQAFEGSRLWVLRTASGLLVSDSVAVAHIVGGLSRAAEDATVDSSPGVVVEFRKTGEPVREVVQVLDVKHAESLVKSLGSAMRITGADVFDADAVRPADAGSDGVRLVTVGGVYVDAARLERVAAFTAAEELAIRRESEGVLPPVVLLSGGLAVGAIMSRRQ